MGGEEGCRRIEAVQAGEEPAQHRWVAGFGRVGVGQGAYMKCANAILIVALCSTVALAGTGRSSADKPLTPFEQMLMNNEKQFIEAAKKGDVAFFKNTLTSDFSFVEFDGQLYERQDMIDQFAQGGVDLMPYEMKVVSLG